MKMRFGFALKWSIIAAFFLGAAWLIYVYSHGHYPGQPFDGPPLALVGARIYDPVGDSLIEGATVVVSGRLITEVSASASIPDGSRILWVSGLTLLPGLIDSHVHMSGIRARIPDGRRELGALAYFWKFMRRFPDRRRALIESGITTVKSQGDPYPWIVKLAERVERHELAGPRIFAAGPAITAPGGHPVAQLRQAGQGDSSFIAQVTRQVSGPAQARSAVEAIARRVDFITAVLEQRGDPNLPTLPPAVLHTISSTAHDEGLRVIVHVSTAGQLDLALPAGVDGIEHVPYDRPLAAVALDELRGRHVFIDPTLQALEQQLGELQGDTAAAREARANTRRLCEAGVAIVAGSDAPSAGTTFGFTLHEELRNLVEVGMSPGEAIAAATIVAANYLGRADSLGTIEPGKWADIIAVAGDPLTDITAASDIYLVIADGQLLFDRLDRVKREGGIIAGPAPPSSARGAIIARAASPSSLQAGIIAGAAPPSRSPAGPPGSGR